MISWCLCGVIGLAFSITLFSFLVGIRPLSLTAVNQLFLPVLVAFLSAILLKATVSRWLGTELNRCTAYRRAIWLGTVGFLTVILIFWTGTTFLPGIIGAHSLEIIATGEASPDSQGSEVWIKSIHYGNGKEVDLSELSATGEWTMEYEGYLASYQEQPAALQWQGMTDFLRIAFEANDINGKVLLRWDDDEQELDLYASNPMNYMHSAGQSVSIESLLLRIMQALPLFAVLMLSTALFQPSQIAFRKEALSFITKTVDKAKEALVAPNSKGHWIVLAAIVVVGIASRIYYLNRPVRYDEAYTFLHFATEPFSQAASNYFAPNNHLLHTILVRFAYLLFGTAPWIIRLPAFVAGVMIIPASYLAARLHYNKEVALLTSALVVSTFPLLFHSVNARGYTIVCLCFVLLLSLATYLNRSCNWLGWCLFIVLSVAGFYTIPIFVLPFSAVWIWLFVSVIIERREKSLRKKWLGYLVGASVLILVGVILAYTPVFLNSGISAVTANEFISSQGFEYFLSELPDKLQQTWNVWNTGIPVVPVRIFMLCALGLGLVFHRQVSPYKIPLFIVTLFVSLAVLSVRSVVPPIRVWLFLLPVYLITVSAGCFWLYVQLTRWLKTSKKCLDLSWGMFCILVCLYFCLDIWQTKAIHRPSETVLLPRVDEVASLLMTSLEPGDNVLTNHQESLTFYFVMYGFPEPHWNGERMKDSKRVVLVADGKNYSSMMRNILSQHDLSVPDDDTTQWNALGEVGDVRVYATELMD